MSSNPKDKNVDRRSRSGTDSRGRYLSPASPEISSKIETSKLTKALLKLRGEEISFDACASSTGPCL